MPIAPASPYGVRPGARRRAAAREASALLPVAATVMISASPDSARPKVRRIC